MPSGHYVVIRRLSSKEEKRRIVSAVLLPDENTTSLVGFDNKTNVIHRNKHGLDREIANGMAIYLGSRFADSWLRRFSGHTQVNAGDLRALRYPSLETLRSWGNKVARNFPNQEEIDLLVGGANV
jgi:adenine-specific DNA-methyltransferase